MAHESFENLTADADTQTRKAVHAAQDVADRAGSYVQQQVTQLTDRAQDLAREANDRVKDYTGRPIEAWLTDIREFVRLHPLGMLAATIGVGYIIGKAMKR